MTQETKNQNECELCNCKCYCYEDCKCDDIYSMPRIGDVAPEFTAISTQGEINFPTDYRGKWVIFFSHPADFTPVCTTEFIEFGTMAKEFEAINCKLIGLSIDGIFSHIAWLRTIKERICYNGTANLNITFPLIADISMEVAKKYGMLQPHESSTSTVRAVFFIDPKGVIRAMIYYPMALGRNLDEIKRALIGLQTIDVYGVALPANWNPEDNVIMPPPSTCVAAQERVDSAKKGDLQYYDWFLTTKKLPKNNITKE